MTQPPHFFPNKSLYMLRPAAVCLVVVLVACACACALAWVGAPARAYGEDIDTDPEPNVLQLEVERSAVALDEAVASRDEIEDTLAANEARIVELEGQIEEQQRRSSEAAVELYKSQHDALGLLDLVLGATSFDDFVFRFDSVNRITESRIAEMVRLVTLREELAAANGQLEEERAEADARVIEADRALTAAQVARLEAQRRAEEEARQQAEAAAAAAAAAEAAAAPDQASGEGGAQAVEVSAPVQSEEADAISNDVSWISDQDAFVSEWTWRIDSYLAGSPLAGQGHAFAVAAWNYGVDPRWSPAIAYLESSLGAYCFASHNAWGWGDCEWGSWEEAINDHVRGLARGYGYTVSVDAARKYCPPNWQHWYDVVSAQMNRI